MPAPVVGRDAELASLHDFVERVAAGAVALVLEGEAGMGKTTLWWAGIADAEQAGRRVLQALPAESETALSFSALGDLLDGVLEEALAPLPGGQRAALSRALVLDDDAGPAPDAHAVGVAVLSAIRALAAAAPLVIAVDDVQWLDDASSAALAYAARRLRSEPVGVLLSRRTGLDSALAGELRRCLPGERFASLIVGPLDIGAMQRVIHEHLEVTLPRPLLAEVHQAAGGSPFYALEIVRTLQRGSVSVEAGQPLPVPDSLHDLVHGRLLALPPDTRDCLLAAAAHAHPTLSITETVSGVPCGEGLAPALEARIVDLDGERIRFTHPLLAAGAYEIADPLRRREVHRRLAEVLVDPEARAWQLAGSVDRPDERVAAILEEGAEDARSRGAPRPAALLLERAAELTPADSEPAVQRRRVAAAYAHHAAGDTERARVLLEPALAQASPGQERAGLLVALARIRSYGDDIRGANELYREALDEAEAGSLVEAFAQEGAGGTLFRLRESLSEAVDMSGAAAATARILGAAQLEAETLATKAVAEATLGRPQALETASAALALQAFCEDRPILRQPIFAVTVVRFWHDDLRGAHEAFRALAVAARELGDESSLPYTHVMLGQIECALGRFDEALGSANDSHLVAEQAGQWALVAYALAVRALAEALLGRAADADRSARRALELAEATNGVPAWIFATWALGHLALATGESGRAADVLQPLVEHHVREQIAEPGALPFMADAIEALVESGRTDEATVLLDGYRGASERLDRRRGIAASHRLSGLVAAASGDVDGAAGELRAAVDLSSNGDTPFEHARALLGLGAVQRRLKHRREARTTLEEALAEFESVGAALWAERARAELKRISGRAATPGALTPAEERVAVLVSEGKTNREVAAALFVSDRTVEGHLSRIFGKLGIRHRTELAGALQTQGIASPNTGDAPVSAEPSAS